jgi:hypothetical protein
MCGEGYASPTCVAIIRAPPLVRPWPKALGHSPNQGRSPQRRVYLAGGAQPTAAHPTAKPKRSVKPQTVALFRALGCGDDGDEVVGEAEGVGGEEVVDARELGGADDEAGVVTLLYAIRDLFVDVG